MKKIFKYRFRKFSLPAYNQTNMQRKRQKAAWWNHINFQIHLDNFLTSAKQISTKTKKDWILNNSKFTKQIYGYTCVIRAIFQFLPSVAIEVDNRHRKWTFWPHRQNRLYIQFSYFKDFGCIKSRYQMHIYININHQFKHS